MCTILDQLMYDPPAVRTRQQTDLEVWLQSLVQQNWLGTGLMIYRPDQPTRSTALRMYEAEYQLDKATITPECRHLIRNSLMCRLIRPLGL